MTEGRDPAVPGQDEAPEPDYREGLILRPPSEITLRKPSASALQAVEEDDQEPVIALERAGPRPTEHVSWAPYRPVRRAGRWSLIVAGVVGGALGGVVTLVLLLVLARSTPLAGLLPGQAGGAPGVLRITSPVDGARVDDSILVEGTIAEGAATTVWVIVNPIEEPVNLAYYWTGASAPVRGGTWSATAVLGRPGPIDAHKRFEIMVVARPTVALSEGLVLGAWPDAEWRSQVVGVIRR